MTGGYIAAKNRIDLQNVDTVDRPYTGPDIGVRIQGSSELTTYEDGSVIAIDARRDAEIEGHLIAGGEVRNIRDAETGGYIGSVYEPFLSKVDTEIRIKAEHQVRIGTMIKAGGLIKLTGGADPRVGDPNDIFNFTGASILIYGSAELQTWGEASRIVLEGPAEIKVLTPTHFQEIEPDTWVKGDVARIVSHDKFMLGGYVPVPIVLHLWKRDGTNVVTDTITIPAQLVANDALLIANINAQLNGHPDFAELEAKYDGRYFELVGHGYDFAILPDSRNIDLLGLAPVLSSRIYYPPATLTADHPLPTTGRLVADVTLDISLEDEMGDGGTVVGSVTISAASTATNAGLNDLLADINAAFDAGSFAPMNAAIVDGKLVLTALGYEFIVLNTSQHMNLLGFRAPGKRSSIASWRS